MVLFGIKLTLIVLPLQCLQYKDTMAISYIINNNYRTHGDLYVVVTSTYPRNCQ